MKKRIVFLTVSLLVCIWACKEKTTQPVDGSEPGTPELTAADYAQLGANKLYGEWDYKAAKDALLKAVELNPKDAASHAHLAWYWMLEDNMGNSLQAIERAEKANPENPLWVQWHGWICYFFDELECAEKYLKQSIEMQPEQRDAYFVLGRMNYRAGNMEEATEWLEMASQDSTGKISRAMKLIISGQEDEGRQLMWEIQADSKDIYETMVMVPLYEMLDQRDSAFYWLEKNFEAKHPLLPWLRFMPIMRPLHEDPRFSELVAKIGKP